MDTAVVVAPVSPVAEAAASAATSTAPTALLVPGPDVVDVHVETKAPGMTLFDKLNASAATSNSANLHNHSLTPLPPATNKHGKNGGKKKNGAALKRAAAAANPATGKIKNSRLPAVNNDDEDDVQLQRLLASNGFWLPEEDDKLLEKEWATVPPSTNKRNRRDMHRNNNTHNFSANPNNNSNNSRHVTFSDASPTIIPNAAPALAASDEAVETIVALGFDRDLAKFLLEEANGNLDDALEVLLAKN